MLARLGNVHYRVVIMPNNKKKGKGGAKPKSAPTRSNAANKDDLAGLDDLLRYGSN